MSKFKKLYLPLLVSVAMNIGNVCASEGGDDEWDVRYAVSLSEEFAHEMHAISSYAEHALDHVRDSIALEYQLSLIFKEFEGGLLLGQMPSEVIRAIVEHEFGQSFLKYDYSLSAPPAPTTTTPTTTTAFTTAVTASSASSDTFLPASNSTLPHNNNAE